MAKSWRLAESLVSFRNQINTAYPGRNKGSDGTIGDAAHAGTVSDHNPNSAGVVTAFDLTHDPDHGVDIANISSQLVASRDNRIKYIIQNRKILITANGWIWIPYSGGDPHTNHLHLSVGLDYDNGRNWELTGGNDVITVKDFNTGADAAGFKWGKDFNYDQNMPVESFVGLLNGNAPIVTTEAEHALADKITGVKNVIGKDYNSPYVGKKVVDVYPRMVDFWIGQRPSSLSPADDYVEYEIPKLFMKKEK